MSTRLKVRTLDKTASYSISQAKGDAAGTVFTNKGATGTITFTLPTPGQGTLGDYYDFRVQEDFSVIVAAPTVNTLVTLDDATADNVGYQIAGKKVGRGLRAVCTGTVGGSFYWHAHPLGALDGFCVDGTEYPVEIGSVTTDQITGTDSSLGITGQAAAQGGAVAIVGGTSSTSANAGGAVTLTGGTPGATGIGGAVTATGGAGLGGAVGGALTLAAGAGQGTGAGAVASLTGGASGAGATGNGGACSQTGGAALSTDGTGGAAGMVGGAGRGSGLGGAANITGGAGGATGAGGQVNITGGAPTDAAGGAVVIAGAAGVGTNRAGGLASVTGGASTGSATGGVASLVGGAASAATGSGGGVVITAANGNTTGAAGTVVITAGQGGATNVAGGVASLTGGIGNGTGIGGVASLVGGVGGTGGATGKGGAAKVTGGASVATNADGGAAIVAGGAANGSGFIGPVVLGNAQLTPVWYPQAAPAADGADSPITMTVAQMVAGLVSMTPTTGRTVTTPTGAQMDAGVAFADVPGTFGFDFSVQNRAAFASTTAILTLTAGASGMTVTGSALISPGSTARFRAVRTGTTTWICYKIAG